MVLLWRLQLQCFTSPVDFILFVYVLEPSSGDMTKGEPAGLLHGLNLPCFKSEVLAAKVPLACARLKIKPPLPFKMKSYFMTLQRI